MRWIRTYTENMEHTLSMQRSIVIDPRQCEPCFIRDYNYLPLFESLTESVIIIEWDIAVSREDRRLFEKHAADGPGMIHVAPYRHYAFKPASKEYGWVHRTNQGTENQVSEGDPWAVYFGFGLIYLPLWLVMEYVADCHLGREKLIERRGINVANSMKDGVATDVSFSAWHFAATGHTVPIHWDVRPVHLNYQI